MQQQFTEPAKTNKDRQTSDRTALGVYLVEKKDIFYTKGRALAREVYGRMWNIKHSSDENDCAIVKLSK